MRNYIAKADKKTSTTAEVYSMYVGRWQPWHDGHQWLIDQSLEEGKNVLLCIRDVAVDEKNPWTAPTSSFRTRRACGIVASAVSSGLRR